MKSNVAIQEETKQDLILEHIDILADLICAGEEFALLRETLELYAEELEKELSVH